MTAHPTTSAVAAEAVVNLDGTGTWSIGGGTAEPITATTAAAVPYAVLYRTVAAAVERGTAIELTVTLAGVAILLEVSPTGEITRFEMPPDAGAPLGANLTSEMSTNGHAPWSMAEPRRSRRRPRWAIAAAAAALAAAAVVAGLVLMRSAGGTSPPLSMAPATRPTASTPAVSPSTSEVAPALAARELAVSLGASKGGPLTAHVRATAAPTVATLTIWREGRRIARLQLYLTAAQAHWSSRSVTFADTGPGSYRWAATAPGAARVTGTYTVVAKPAPRDRVAERSTPDAVSVTPTPTPGPTPSAPATLQPSTPPPPAATQQPEPHDGPVPGGSTSPPHLGPSV